MEEISRYTPPDWNLKNWARIAYAATLWDKPTIKSLIEVDRKRAAAQIKELTGKKEKEMHLPKAILDEVLWTFKSMGKKIHEWYNYALDILKIPEDIAERVHWTTYGTIGERKTFQDLISSKEFQENRHSVPSEGIYYLACSNVFIEYIHLHWEEMLTFWKAHENESTLLNQKADKVLELIIASVIFFANRDDSRIPVSYVEKYSDVKNMLELSVTGGYSTAARYYWFQLNENQKKDLILPTAEKPYSEYYKLDYLHAKYTGNFPLYDYKKKCFADLFVFFLNYMSDDDLSIWEDKELERGPKIEYALRILIDHWPLEDFLPLAYDLTSKCYKNEENYRDLLGKILTTMRRNNAYGLLNKQNFARKLFKFVWDKLEPNFFVNEASGSQMELLEQIFKAFDFQILNFIINTEYDEGKPRRVLIHLFWKNFVEITRENGWELLEKFACDVLQSENDRTWFRDMFCKYLHSTFG